MSTLGEILDRLEDRKEVFALLAEANDLITVSKLEAVTKASNQDPCALALEAVQAFTSGAKDEAWVKLMGRIQDAESPAAACLAEMISWSLAQ